MGAGGVDDEKVGLFAGLKGADLLVEAEGTGGTHSGPLQDVLWHGMHLGVAANPFVEDSGAQDLNHIVCHVVGAHCDVASGGFEFQDGGCCSSLGGDCRVVGYAHARAAEHCYFRIIDVAIVGGEESGAEELVGEEVVGGSDTVDAADGIHLDHALAEVNGVADIIAFGHVSDGTQELGRAGLRGTGSEEAGYAASSGSVPLFD